MKKIFLAFLVGLSLTSVWLNAGPTQPCSCEFEQSGVCGTLRVTYQAPDEGGPCCYDDAIPGTINKSVKPCGSQTWYETPYMDEATVKIKCNGGACIA